MGGQIYPFSIQWNMRVHFLPLKELFKIDKNSFINSNCLAFCYFGKICYGGVIIWKQFFNTNKVNIITLNHNNLSTEWF